MEQSRIHDYFQFKKSSHKRDRVSPRSVETGKMRKLLQRQETKATAEKDLSETTLEIIETLPRMVESQTRRKVEKILTSVPVKEKFSDLLDPQRSLRLPYKYKKLLSIFEEFDLFMHYARSHAIPSTFSNIKAAVDEKKQTNIRYKEIRQMLYVFPEAFNVQWTVRDFSREFELAFGISGESSISNRKLSFRNNLLEITKNHHRAFLEKLSIRSTIDFEKLNIWHSAFDLDTVPEIPMADLPSQPCELIVEPLDITHPKVRTASEFRDTEKRTAKNEDEERKLSRTKRLLGLCEVLKDIYFTQHSPSIFLASLAKKIKSSKKVLGNCSMIEKDVLEICQIFEEWLSVIKTKSGTVIRMNKQFVLTQEDATARIHQKYN